MSRFSRKITAASFCILLAACGGGGGGGNPANDSSSGNSQNTDGGGAGSDAGSGGTGSSGSPPSTPAFAVDRTARFNKPVGLQLDDAGNLLVHDVGNGLMRRVAASGTVTTLHDRDPELLMDAAGNTFISVRNDVDDPLERDSTEIIRISPDGTRKLIARYVEMPGSVSLSEMQIDTQGQLYVKTRYRTQFWIHKIDPEAPAMDRTFSGGGSDGLVYHLSTYGFLGSLEVDTQGNLLVTTYDPEANLNGVIYVPVSAQPAEGSSAGTVSIPIADNGSGFRGMKFGRDGALYFAYVKLEPIDSTGVSSPNVASELRIRKRNSDGSMVTVLNGFPDGRTSSQVSEPGFAIGMEADASGNVYMADSLEHAIYKIGPDGQISLYAGKPEEAGNSD